MATYIAKISFMADSYYWFQGKPVPAEVADMHSDKVELVK